MSAIKVNFVCDPKAIVYHCIDYITQWGPGCGWHHQDWFKTQFGWTEADTVAAAEYSKLRSQIDPDLHTDLFDWAASGYPENSQFDPLIPFIKHFSERRTVDGQSIADYVESALSAVEKSGKVLAEKIAVKDYFVVFERYAVVFNKTIKPFEYKCYMMWTPNNRSASNGANGYGIFLESNQFILENKFEEAVLPILVHECFHKAIPTRNWLLKYDPENTEFWESLRTDLYGDKFKGFFNEVVTYSLINVHVFKDDPVDMAQRYAIKAAEIPRQARVMRIWLCVQRVAHLWQELDEGKITIEEIRGKLVSITREFILEKISEIEELQRQNGELR